MGMCRQPISSFTRLEHIDTTIRKSTLSRESAIRGNPINHLKGQNGSSYIENRSTLANPIGDPQPPVRGSGQLVAECSSQITSTPHCNIEGVTQTSRLKDVIYGTGDPEKEYSSESKKAING